MRWKNRKVLVTGGTGFIGSFLVERLLDAGAKVRVPMRAQNFRALSERRSEIEWMEGDLRDSAYCAELLNGVDEVFHLAACRRNIAFHEERSGHVLQENLRMSLALVEAIRETKPIPVTYFSTANVPPKTDALSLSKMNVIDGYTLGKALSEIVWHVASHEQGFPLLIVRPVGVYGPRDTFSEDGNVIPALMVKCTKARMAALAPAKKVAAASGKAKAATAVVARPKTSMSLEVWGTGSEERAFLYVEDLITALLTLRDNDATGVQYISSDKVITIRELAEQIRDLVAPGVSIKYLREKQLGARTMPLLPPHPSLRSLSWTPFEKGLKETYESWK